MQGLGARFIQASGNTKLSHNKSVATTYSAIAASCPITCELRGNGCYFEGGRTGLLAKTLNAEAYGMTDLDVARTEARLIDQSGVASALRLHTGGDCRTSEAAEVVGGAATRWRARGGGPVWTYTHAWADVPRSSWGPTVSVLASVDRVEQVSAAQAQGYAVARYVGVFPSKKAWVEGGVRWVPCPSQTHADVTCMGCRLCFDADRLKSRGVGIVFAAHGTWAGKIKRRLEVVR